MTVTFHIFTYLVKSDSYSTTLITVIYHDVSKDNIFVVDNNIGRMMFIKKIFFFRKAFYIHVQICTQSVKGNNTVQCQSFIHYNRRTSHIRSTMAIL